MDGQLALYIGRIQQRFKALRGRFVCINAHTVTDLAALPIQSIENEVPTWLRQADFFFGGGGGDGGGGGGEFARYTVVRRLFA